MSPAERSQTVALLCGAEAMKAQASALLALADAQIHAAMALFGAESPTPTMPLSGEQLVGRPYYGRQKSNGVEHPSQE